jgi:hypothetical protein
MNGKLFDLINIHKSRVHVKLRHGSVLWKTFVVGFRRRSTVRSEM